MPIDIGMMARQTNSKGIVNFVGLLTILEIFLYIGYKALIFFYGHFKVFILSTVIWISFKYRISINLWDIKIEVPNGKKSDNKKKDYSMLQYSYDWKIKTVSSIVFI